MLTCIQSRSWYSQGALWFGFRRKFYFFWCCLVTTTQEWLKWRRTFEGEVKIILFKTDSHFHSFSRAVGNSSLGDIVSFLAFHSNRKVKKNFILQNAKFKFVPHKNLFFQPLSKHFHSGHIFLKKYVFLNMLFILVLSLNILQYPIFSKKYFCYYYCGVVLCTS